MNWNLSRWQLGNGCNSFTGESILACAPPTSGVYGLFNGARTIFIGESANIRQALLCHESEIDFRHLKPMAFTFELCAPELRKLWAAELITTFRPLVKSEAALRELRWLSDRPALNEPDRGGWELGTYTDRQEFPVHESEERPRFRKPLSVKRNLALASVAVFVVTTAAWFYFGMPAQVVIYKDSNGVNSALAQTEVALGPSNTQLNDTAGRSTNQNAGATSVKPPIPPWNDTAQLSEVHSAATEGVVQAEKGPGAATRSEFRKDWSVQISAAPAKEIADGLVQQLKAKGYDGYIMQATVKGQNYYRVRVGRFNTQEHSESMRRSLARQEGYHDAYLASD
jgi:SPOR domain